MKDPASPMSLADVSLLLNAAAKISNHRHFVIGGSLAAIGAMLTSPIEMVMSRDVDLYPKFDPGRGFIEIAAQLSEGTDFAREHGFYADPISPSVMTLPRGWEGRLLQIPLENGVVAWFIDPNDAAVSKLVRGHANDERWIAAGLRAGILNAETICLRLADSPASADESQTARTVLGRCQSQLADPYQPGSDADCVSPAHQLRNGG